MRGLSNALLRFSLSTHESSVSSDAGIESCSTSASAAESTSGSSYGATTNEQTGACAPHLDEISRGSGPHTLRGGPAGCSFSSSEDTMRPAALREAKLSAAAAKCAQNPLLGEMKGG